MFARENALPGTAPFRFTPSSFEGLGVRCENAVVPAPACQPPAFEGSSSHARRASCGGAIHPDAPGRGTFGHGDSSAGKGKRLVEAASPIQAGPESEGGVRRRRTPTPWPTRPSNFFERIVVRSAVSGLGGRGVPIRGHTRSPSSTSDPANHPHAPIARWTCSRGGWTPLQPEGTSPVPAPSAPNCTPVQLVPPRAGLLPKAQRPRRVANEADGRECGTFRRIGKRARSARDLSTPPMSTLCAEFRGVVSVYLKRSGMKGRELGTLALDDAWFISTLNRGRSPRLSTVDRVLRFMGHAPIGPVSREEVETFLAPGHIRKSTFGAEVAGNPSFVTRLRRGSSPRLNTVERVSEWIRNVTGDSGRIVTAQALAVMARAASTVAPDMDGQDAPCDVSTLETSHDAPPLTLDETTFLTTPEAAAVLGSSPAWFQNTC